MVIIYPSCRVRKKKKIALPWGFSTDFYMCKSLAFYMLIGIKRETEKLKRHQDDEHVFSPKRSFRSADSKETVN